MFLSVRHSFQWGYRFSRVRVSEIAEFELRGGPGEWGFCSVEGAVTSLMRYSPVEIKDRIYMFVNNPLKMRPYAQRQREFVSGSGQLTPSMRTFRPVFAPAPEGENRLTRRVPGQPILIGHSPHAGRQRCWSVRPSRFPLAWPSGWCGASVTTYDRSSLLASKVLLDIARR